MKKVSEMNVYELKDLIREAEERLKLWSEEPLTLRFGFRDTGNEEYWVFDYHTSQEELSRIEAYIYEWALRIKEIGLLNYYKKEIDGYARNLDVRIPLFQISASYTKEGAYD